MITPLSTKDINVGATGGPSASAVSSAPLAPLDWTLDVAKRFDVLAKDATCSAKTRRGTRHVDVLVRGSIWLFFIGYSEGT